MNAASKLGENLAKADEILVTAATREQLGDVVGLRFEALDTFVPGSTRNIRVLTA